MQSKKELNNLIKFILLIIILIIFFCLIYGVPKAEPSEFKFRKWDNSELLKWDKQIHALGGVVLNNQLDKYNLWGNAFLIGQIIHLGWETKDGFKRWGFCWQDHLAFTSGQLLQGLLDHIFFKETIYSNKDLKKIVKKRLNKFLYEQKK